MNKKYYEVSGMGLTRLEESFEKYFNLDNDVLSTIMLNIECPWDTSYCPSMDYVFTEIKDKFSLYDLASIFEIKRTEFIKDDESTNGYIIYIPDYIVKKFEYTKEDCIQLFCDLFSKLANERFLTYLGPLSEENKVNIRNDIAFLDINGWC